MRYSIKAIAFFLIVVLLFGGLVWSRYQQLYSQHLSARETTFHSSYNSIISSFQLVAKTLANEVIYQDDTLKLVHAIVTSEGEQRNYMRGLLYRKLYSTYTRANQYSVRQLHFHFPDGRSMLRFHKLNKADDDLSIYRPSVRIANEQQREVNGYESGRIVHGFRNVYPLYYQGTPIGSVEISNSFQQLRKILMETSSDSNYLFVMLKADLWHKLAAGQQVFYRGSTLHDDYVSENPHTCRHENFGEIAEVTDDMHSMLASLRDHQDLKDGLASEGDFALVMNWEKQIYSVLFHSVKNIEGKHAAYILDIKPEPVIQALQNDALVQFFIAVVFALILVVFRLKLLLVREEQKKTSAFLQTITSYMGEGLYATDQHGKVTFVNPEASSLLDYTQNEVVGRDAHNLFHVDDEQHQDEGCVILNSIMNNKTYKQEQVFFRDKGQQVFPVELTCTPFNNQGEIAGTITLFRDISGRRKRELELATTQRKLTEANLSLSQLASLDGLTGLSNRRTFDQMLITMWKGAYRNKSNLAILMIDIDYFKAYNDTYGHQQGDDCLRHVTKIIQESCLRPSDFTARYGGEEFVVLMPETSLYDASSVARRIVNNLRNEKIPHSGSSLGEMVTLSIGVCSQCPEDLGDEQSLITCADSHLYHAKKAGRNQVCSCDLVG